MPEAIYQFPRGFLWGTATAAHQVEGNNANNNWSRWENEPGRIIENQKAGLACDWWGGRWKEDFERARDTGQNAHRFSIEWSRIQPAMDQWDDEALEKYVEMARWLYRNNMTPMVTLHHFTDPLWLTDLGGWENEETPAHFARFVRRVVSALKDYVSLWITINEPNVYIVSGWAGGPFPPGKMDLGLAATVTANMVKGHAAAYRVIHELQSAAQVGVATNYRSFMPARKWMPFDRLAVNVENQLFNKAFNDCLASGKLNLILKRFNIPEAANTQDFIGLNYYTRDIVKFDLLKPNEIYEKHIAPENAELSPNGFIANVPDGMWDGLKWAHGYNLPIIITENGIEDNEDTLRPRYTIAHIHEMWRAVNFNWRVKGYFHWSLVDNFEWERAWTQRFGLWGLNVATQERIRRKSVDMYETICKENGISSAMVQKFTPEIFDALFPSD
jgi:beta-glucosidase